MLVAIEQNLPRKNAFEVLMKRKMADVPTKDPKHQKHKLFNDVVDIPFDKLSFWQSAQNPLTTGCFAACRELAASLYRYGKYLNQSNERVTKSASRTEVLNENLSKIINEASRNKLSEKYQKLNKELGDKDYYNPVSIDLHENSSCSRRLLNDVLNGSKKSNYP